MTVVMPHAGVSSIDLTAIISLLDIVAEAEKHDIQVGSAHPPTTQTRCCLHMDGHTA